VRRAHDQTDAHNGGVLPITALNQLSREEFGEALRPLFEAAARLADALYGERPFGGYQELILLVLKERLDKPREEELRTGVRDMFLIARDRLRWLTE
jgi:2-oxo-4-hydroxy-4-carboxy--5-ureidoimidazoline (OHCU) decarboxylase